MALTFNGKLKEVSNLEELKVLVPKVSGLWFKSRKASFEARAKELVPTELEDTVGFSAIFIDPGLRFELPLSHVETHGIKSLKEVSSLLSLLVEEDCGEKSASTLFLDKVMKVSEELFVLPEKRDLNSLHQLIFQINDITQRIMPFMKDSSRPQALEIFVDEVIGELALLVSESCPTELVLLPVQILSDRCNLIATICQNATEVSTVVDLFKDPAFQVSELRSVWYVQSALFELQSRFCELTEGGTDFSLSVDDAKVICGCIFDNSKDGKGIESFEIKLLALFFPLIKDDFEQVLDFAKSFSTQSGAHRLIALYIKEGQKFSESQLLDLAKAVRSEHFLGLGVSLRLKELAEELGFVDLKLQEFFEDKFQERERGNPEDALLALLTAGGLEGIMMIEGPDGVDFDAAFFGGDPSSLFAELSMRLSSEECMCISCQIKRIEDPAKQAELKNEFEAMQKRWNGKGGLVRTETGFGFEKAADKEAFLSDPEASDELKGMLRKMVESN